MKKILLLFIFGSITLFSSGQNIIDILKILPKQYSFLPDTTIDQAAKYFIQESKVKTKFSSNPNLGLLAHYSANEIHFKVLDFKNGYAEYFIEACDDAGSCIFKLNKICYWNKKNGDKVVGFIITDVSVYDTSKWYFFLLSHGKITPIKEHDILPDFKEYFRQSFQKVAINVIQNESYKISEVEFTADEIEAKTKEIKNTNIFCDMKLPQNGKDIVVWSYQIDEDYWINKIFSSVMEEDSKKVILFWKDGVFEMKQ